MSPPHQITMLKFIKNLSSLSSTHEPLQNSNAIDILIELLKSTRQKDAVTRNSNRSASDPVRLPPFHREISNQILNTMYNLCRHDKGRQEEAALSDIIPLLKEVVQEGGPLKEFALPVLLEMVNSGKVARKMLWDAKGLAFYVSLLGDRNWAVTALDAIFVWYVPRGLCLQCPLLNTSVGSRKRLLASSSISCHRIRALRQPSSPHTHQQHYRNLLSKTCSSLYRSSSVYPHQSQHLSPHPKSSNAPNKNSPTKTPSPASTSCVSSAQSATPKKKAATSSAPSAATSASAPSSNTTAPSSSAKWPKNSSAHATKSTSTPWAPAPRASAVSPAQPVSADLLHLPVEETALDLARVPRSSASRRLPQIA
jgi:hypothetical protein